MKHKRGLLAICIIICLFSIATASASDMNDGILASDNDLIENDATGSTEILSANPDGTFTDLANEIDRATDELNLTRNYRYTDDSIYKDGIPIDKSIVINGNGFTINGNNQAKAFNVKSSSVTLNDISVVNASAEEYGAIYWSGADGSVANCIFVNCDGAIFWYAADGSVANCIFMNCHSKYFSAIEWGGENGTITNCNFTNCTAGEDGGVIDINVGTITNCNFANCAAGEDGGVIDFGDGTITNCNFTNCTAGRSSGAIYYAGDATITNCNFINCTAEYSGGALSSSYGTATITNCNFTNCTAEDGGAIYYVGDGTITNCNFINCTAEYSGGAIYYIGDGTITNCNFTNCTAEDGGATFQGIVANCTFINNSAKYGGAMYGGTAVNCTFNWNTATYYGGAVYDARVSTSSKFNNNHAPNGKDTYNVTWFDRVDGKTFTDLKNLIEESSSDVYLNDDYTFDLNSDYNLLDGINVDHAVTVHGNGHTINGNNEARIFNVDAKEVIFKDMLFVNAISFNSGGAIYKGISVNCTFINNSADEYGGAICEGVAVNCTFINNSANVHGGAMYGGTAVNCTFINNSANVHGSAICEGVAVNCTFINNSADLGAISSGVAVNCAFINNSAVTGGAMRSGYAVNCTFINNSAVTGGAMSGGYAVNCTFNYNTATSYGGAVYDAKVSTSSKFNNNHAFDGDDTYDVTWFDEVDGKTFTDLKNLIGENGSDVYLNDDYTFDLKSDYNLLDGINVDHAVTLHGNGHTVNGYNMAPIFNVDAEEVIFKDIFFVNANSRGSGGAINGQSSAVNCTFINNSADEYGGAIYNGSALNCTFTNNHAHIYGGATYYSKVTNCIFKGKSTGEGDNDVYPILDTVLTVRYDNTTKNIAATVKDANGNPVSGIKVGFACNGVKYVLTDVNGQALFSTSSLAGGSNTVKIMAYGNEAYKNSNQETVTFTIGSKEMSKIFLRNALYFVTQTKMVQVTLWDGNNQPLANKTVYIRAYDSIWHGVTDENGDAFVRVGIGFGTHDATVSFDGDDQYNSSTRAGYIRVIKQTPSVMVRGADTMFKANDDNKIVKVHLRDRYDKALPEGSKIVIKLNGKTYVGTTDINGVAHIKISINTVGTFTAQAMYGGNTAYNPVTRDVKIRIV